MLAKKGQGSWIPLFFPAMAVRHKFSPTQICTFGNTIFTAQITLAYKKLSEKQDHKVSYIHAHCHRHFRNDLRITKDYIEFDMNSEILSIKLLYIG